MKKRENALALVEPTFYWAGVGAGGGQRLTIKNNN